MAPISVDRAVLRRGRTATNLHFLLFGIAQGSWISQVGVVADRLRLSTGALSVALLVLAVGSIVGMATLGRLVDRFGVHRVLVPAAFLQGPLLLPMAVAPDLATLVVALLIFGVISGVLDVAINAGAIEVERAYGRSIVTSFHAVFSIGCFVGVGAGGLCSAAEIGAGPTFLVASLLTTLLTLASRWRVLPSNQEPARPAEPGRPVASGPEPGQVPAATRTSRVRLDLLLLGVLAMSALMVEGVAADWSAVYLQRDLGSSAAVAASAYAAFAVLMTAGRAGGGWLLARFGPVAVVRVGGVVAALGFGVALLLHELIATVVGFACLGIGLSCTAPQIYVAAGSRDVRSTGRFLARVIGVGYAGFVLGPFVIGSVGTAVGLRAALGIPVVLVLVVALGAGLLRPPTGGPPAP